MAVFAVDVIAALILIVMSPFAWSIAFQPPAAGQPGRMTAVLFAVVITWSAFRFAFLVIGRFA